MTTSLIADRCRWWGVLSCDEATGPRHGERPRRSLPGRRRWRAAWGWLGDRLPASTSPVNITSPVYEKRRYANRSQMVERQLTVHVNIFIHIGGDGLLFCTDTLKTSDFDPEWRKYKVMILPNWQIISSVCKGTNNQQKITFYWPLFSYLSKTCINCEVPVSKPRGCASGLWQDIKSLYLFNLFKSLGEDLEPSVHW